MRRRLALDGRVHGENDFGGAASDALDELGQIEPLGRDAIERGKRAPEHVIAALEDARALERPKVGNVLDDANDARLALRVTADRARVGGIEIAAIGACLERRRGLGQRIRQRLQQRLALLQKRQRGAACRTRSQSR